ncbi:MAG TPA: HAMP domain-containing sensor histidine kinase [Jatrophihabitans sp.]|nr:HAMP domain-containing sensor histidine kinase [Jatrophihabitans sp.]
MRSLASRISLLAVAVAVITALLAGLLAANLIQRTARDSARSTLKQLADVAQSTANAGANPEAAQSRARAQLRVLKINTAAIAGDGSISTATPLLHRVLTKHDIAAVLAGNSVSAQRRVAGQLVLLEARPTKAGGIALAQRRADATAAGDQAVRRIIWALLIAVGIAVLLGLAVAVRISRPLKRTAAAAHALAAGHRDVAVPPQGPAEVVEVGTAVNTLAAALSHSEARQREFLLSVSHDLRTPLTAIAGYAESLSDGVVPPEEAAGVGAVMLTEARRLNRLVADLLDLARLGAQEFRIEWSDVDLTELVYAAGRVWSDRCAAAAVPFAVQAEPRPLWLRTDAARVRQIVDGLLENALRVTPAGAPIVLAAFAAAPDQLVVEVRDGGPGLNDEDLAVAFQRSVLYERYRGVRQVGTGLGLAIVDGLARRLGGSVEAGHAPEGGARFTVRLPVSTSNEW